jgi:hypothetical protein
MVGSPWRWSADVAALEGATVGEGKVTGFTARTSKLG